MSATKERASVFAACFVIAAAGLVGDGMASPRGALAIGAVIATVVTAAMAVCDRKEER